MKAHGLHDLILQISSCLTRSPPGEIDLSEISKRTGVDRRTVAKWMTTILVIQKYTPALKASGKHSIKKLDDPKFASRPLSAKLLELFYTSARDGHVKLCEAEDETTANLIRMRLLDRDKVGGVHCYVFSPTGLKLAFELRDLVNKFQESFLDLDWADTVKASAIAEKWERKLDAFNSRLLKLHARARAAGRYINMDRYL